MLRALLILLVMWLTACGPGPLPTSTLPTSPGQELLGVLVTPDEVVVPVGSTVQLKATGLYGDRQSTDLTHVATWTSSDASVASVVGDLDAEGQFLANAVGSTDVTATVDGISSTPVPLRVTDQAITDLAVDPSELVVELGQEVQLTATATWTDGSRTEATGLVRWITDDGAIASLSDGVLTANATGTTTVHAQFEDVVSNTVRVEVLREASPDLKIATLSASPYAGRITAVVEIENTGDSGASDFWVDGFLDFSGVPGPGDYGDVFQRVAWLGPGDTTQVVLELDAEPGSYELTVSVDTEDEVDESNESNNHADTPVTVAAGGTTGTTTTPPEPPDLHVDRVDFLSDGSWVYYEVEISNYGDQGAGPFYVDVFADEWSAPALQSNGDDWAEVQWIAAWDTITLDFLVEVDCSYGCVSWVMVDSWNDVAEGDESDTVYGPISVY